MTRRNPAQHKHVYEKRRLHTVAIIAGIAIGAAALTTSAQDADPPAPSAPPPAAPQEPAPTATPIAPANPAEKPATRDANQTAENNVADNEMTPAMHAAVNKGFEALIRTQDDAGAFSSARYEKHAGITGLACLALMSDGNLPGRGTYAKNVERGLEFVLSQVNETGLIAADNSHGPMYGHGFATLFLGEIYGMTRGGPDTALSARIHEALVKSVRLIVNTQNEEGGWRYNPVPHDADISVTICEIMALRSARNAGIEVPKDTIDRAVEYVRACQSVDGGFMYQKARGGSAWPRSAAGLASLFYAGVYKDDAIDRAVGYLRNNAMPGTGQASGAHYFYGHYYAVQAMYLAGGDDWQLWWPKIRDEVITLQNPDGSWSDNTAGEAYGTAMALIILQMPKRYLPIFQR